MQSAKQVVTELLSLCGVRVDGDNPWDMRVKDDRVYAHVLQGKNLGLGESYMNGWWDCRRLDELIYRILKERLHEKIRGSRRLRLLTVQAVILNRQSGRRSRGVAERHYDLGNDLFLSFLDPYNQYSCAYFDGTDDLAEAQIKKMELICRKLALQAPDRVLDIGFGWGGLARYMAETYGCRVTGVNISKEQTAHAREACRNLPVELQEMDYRDITDRYDKIVSVGMFEHVGRLNHRTFMEIAHRALEKSGVFLLHTIGRNDSGIATDPWIDKYIFPNGELPSIAQIAASAEGLFVVEDLHNLGPHYDRTLMAWHARFLKAWPTLQGKYDERFKRMWEYYLLSCAAAFRARDNQLWQFVFTKCGTPQPKCRF